MAHVLRVLNVSALILSLAACSGFTEGEHDESSSGGSGSGGDGTGGVSQGTGGAVGTGGLASTGGNSASGGNSSAGGSGGSGTGGDGAGGGPTATGGDTGSGGDTGTGGDGTGGSTDGAIPMGNPPVPSAGCGSPTTLQTQQYTIQSGGQSRVYYVDLPSDYDPNEPYRLIYASHWIGSKWEDVEGQDFYFLKPLIEADGEQAIFVAPSSDGATWQEKDHALFDDIMAHMDESVCFDKTRVFATGFSFGGMITYSLSTNHQQVIRAAVGIAPANYNIWLPEKTREPIAWMHMTGLSDGTCPWVNNEQQQRGAKFIAIEKAEDNGCTVPSDIPVWQNGDHFCYDFEDCDPEHPTRVCTFDGGHTNIDNEAGGNWIPQESWAFFKQF